MPRLEFEFAKTKRPLVKMIFGWASPAQIANLSNAVPIEIVSSKKQFDKKRIYCLFQLDGDNAKSACTIAPRTAQSDLQNLSDRVLISEMLILHARHKSERKYCFVSKDACIEFKQGALFTASLESFEKLVTQNAIEWASEFRRESGIIEARSICSAELPSVVNYFDKQVKNFKIDPLGVQHG